MRKLRLSLALCAGVLAASAATAFGGPPAFDKAQGAGTFGGCSIIPIEFPCRGPFNFAFSAIQRGFGEHATGFFKRSFGTTPLESGIHGRVTCLNVLGNTAVLGGFFTRSGDPALIGEAFYVWMVDNGPSGSSPPDLISLFWLPDPDDGTVPPGAPHVCPQPFPSFAGYFPVTSGNIVVEDESPPGRVSAG